MTITHEDVEDLRPGDVVEITRTEWPAGSAVRGPLSASEGLDKALYILDGFFGVRGIDGEPYDPSGTLTVISRAPRPLYVNHKRTTPIDGDVVRDGEDRLWMFDHFGTWQGVESTCEESNRLTGMEQPLTLLVDGNTKKVVVQ